jgi:hypothetical protein
MLRNSFPEARLAATSSLRLIAVDQVRVQTSVLVMSLGAQALLYTANKTDGGRGGSKMVARYRPCTVRCDSRQPDGFQTMTKASKQSLFYRPTETSVVDTWCQHASSATAAGCWVPGLARASCGVANALSLKFT